MPGARSVLGARQVPDKVFEPKSKRAGSVTDTEQALVTQFVRDQPREITNGQVQALAKVLRRSKDCVKGMVEKAREEFQASAEFYVNSHKTAVSRALSVLNKDGEHDPKALDVAARSSAWALENLSAEGVRVVDKPSAGKGDTGPRILVGVNIGGMNPSTTTVEAAVIPPSTPPSTEPGDSL